MIWILLVSSTGKNSNVPTNTPSAFHVEMTTWNRRGVFVGVVLIYEGDLMRK